MKSLFIASIIFLGSNSFAGNNKNIAEVQCHSAFRAYSIEIRTTYGTSTVVKTSEVKLISIRNSFEAGSGKLNVTATQAYINNKGMLSAVFQIPRKNGTPKNIQIDAESKTIRSDLEELEQNVVCDKVSLDV